MDNNENEELIKIFTEEATDLLNAIALTLQKWATDLANKIYLVDLKRDLHTLKGGARMVSQPELSTLAHELESLCEALENGSVPINKESYNLICDTHDRMTLMIEALSKKESPLSSSDLIDKFKEKIGGEKKKTDVVSSKKTPVMEVQAQTISAITLNEVIRVRTDLLEKLNTLSIENNIIRVNLGHQIENIKINTTEISKLIKSLQEKIKIVPKEFNLSVTSEVMGLINICKNLLQVYSNAESELSQQGRVALDLQDKLVDTRMVPFNSVVPRLSRISRQVSAELKKKVDFTVVQAEGEIDRNLLENLVPSLEHLLRNAIDHGIELPKVRLQERKSEIGKIYLRFFRMGNDACMEIKDDGMGIDTDAVRRKAENLGLIKKGAAISDDEVIRYILEPGFSTREDVSEISGRGVGMDIVNTVVKGLGGNLSIESKRGVGSKFSVRLPFTTSMNRALLVVIQGQTYGILLSNIESILLLNIKQAKDLLNQKPSFFQKGDKKYQLKYLGGALGLQDSPDFISKEKQTFPVLLFNFSDFNAALLVDALVGSQEVVVQSLGPQFKLIDIFSGATLLADGRVVIILDTYSITARIAKQMTELSEKSNGLKKEVLVMVVDDSVTIRTVTKNFLERHKYAVITAKDGVDALAKLEKEKPDIILLDVEMPRMGGFEFAEKVRSHSRFLTIPIIMITFLAGDEQRKLAASLGIKKFIHKPYQEIELLEAIESLLEKRA